jgi:hypothetical protein
VPILWSDTLGPTDEVTIVLSKNGGGTYRWRLIPRTFADGIETIVVRPGWATRRGRLQIAWATDENVADVSDATFTIDAAGSRRR